MSSGLRLLYFTYSFPAPVADLAALKTRLGEFPFVHFISSWVTDTRLDCYGVYSSPISLSSLAIDGIEPQLVESNNSHSGTPFHSFGTPPHMHYEEPAPDDLESDIEDTMSDSNSDLGVVPIYTDHQPASAAAGGAAARLDSAAFSMPLVAPTSDTGTAPVSTTGGDAATREPSEVQYIWVQGLPQVVKDRVIAYFERRGLKTHVMPYFGAKRNPLDDYNGEDALVLTMKPKSTFWSRVQEVAEIPNPQFGYVVMCSDCPLEHALLDIINPTSRDEMRARFHEVTPPEDPAAPLYLQLDIDAAATSDQHTLAFFFMIRVTYPVSMEQTDLAEHINALDILQYSASYVRVNDSRELWMYIVAHNDRKQLLLDDFCSRDSHVLTHKSPRLFLSEIAASDWGYIARGFDMDTFLANPAHLHPVVDVEQPVDSFMLTLVPPPAVPSRPPTAPAAAPAPAGRPRAPPPAPRRAAPGATLPPPQLQTLTTTPVAKMPCIFCPSQDPAVRTQIVEHLRQYDSVYCYSASNHVPYAGEKTIVIMQGHYSLSGHEVLLALITRTTLHGTPLAHDRLIMIQPGSDERPQTYRASDVVKQMILRNFMQLQPPQLMQLTARGLDTFFELRLHHPAEDFPSLLARLQRVSTRDGPALIVQERPRRLQQQPMPASVAPVAAPAFDPPAELRAEAQYTSKQTIAEKVKLMEKFTFVEHVAF